MSSAMIEFNDKACVSYCMRNPWRDSMINFHITCRADIRTGLYLLHNGPRKYWTRCTGPVVLSWNSFSLPVSDQTAVTNCTDCATGTLSALFEYELVRCADLLTALDHDGIKNACLPKFASATDRPRGLQ